MDFAGGGFGGVFDVVAVVVDAVQVAGCGGEFGGHFWVVVRGRLAFVG